MLFGKVVFSMAQAFSPEQMEQLVAYASRRLGTTPEQLKTAFQQGGLSALSDALTPAEASTAEALLKDKDAAAKLMNNPQVQKLLAQLLGNM